MMRRSDLIVSVVTLAVLALGILGYQMAAPGIGFWEAFYRSVQLFALGFVPPAEPEIGFWEAFYQAFHRFIPGYEQPAHEQSLPLPLQIARFLAAGFLVLAIIRLVGTRLWRWFAIRWQAFAYQKMRHVLIGFGTLNQAIARHLADQKLPMTIVARAFDGADKEFARRAGALLMERNVTDPGAFENLRLSRARRIIISCGDDSLTLEIAQKIGARRTRGPSPEEPSHEDPDPIADPENQSGTWYRIKDWFLPSKADAEEVVFAHVGSIALNGGLELTRDLGFPTDRKFTAFSIQKETARYLFACAALPEIARENGQDRVHVVIVGMGGLGEAVLQEALVRSCAAGLAPPRLTVVDRDIESAEGRIQAALPFFFDDTLPRQDRPTISFVRAAAEQIDRGLPTLDKSDATLQPVTAWIFCCRDDVTNLSAAYRLEAAMNCGRCQPAPIFARQWQGGMQDTKKIVPGQTDPLHLVAPFGGVSNIVPSLSILDENWTGLARSINAAYDSITELQNRDFAEHEIIKAFGPPPWPENQGPAPGPERDRFVAKVHAIQQKFWAKWSELTDDVRSVNLSAAAHAAIHLSDLGLHWKGRFANELPHVPANLVAQFIGSDARKDLSETTLIGRVAAAEHRRWMYERAIHGWCQGGSRENSLRIHTKLIPYSELDAKNAGKASCRNPTDWDYRRTDLSILEGILVHLRDRHCGENVPVAAMKNVSIGGAQGKGGNAVNDALMLENVEDGITELRLRVPVSAQGDDGRKLSANQKQSLKAIKKWANGPEAVLLVLDLVSLETTSPGSFRKYLQRATEHAAAGQVHVRIRHADTGSERIKAKQPA